LGNVAVLLHAGYKPRRAVDLNLVSALTAFLGAGAMLAVHLNDSQINCIAPVAAGGFLYLAIGNLGPELWRSASLRVRATSSLATFAGVVSMAVMHRFA
jgi:zinc transporter ZupT